MSAPVEGLLPGGYVPTDPAECVDALMKGINQCARRAAQDPSAQEARDYAAACLNFAQAIVVLDPGLTSDGVPLEDQHAQEIALARVASGSGARDGQQRLDKARDRAGAPTPGKQG